MEPVKQLGRGGKLAGSWGEGARPDTGPGWMIVAWSAEGKISWLGGATSPPSTYRWQPLNTAWWPRFLASKHKPHRACLWACSSLVSTSLMLNILVSGFLLSAALHLSTVSLSALEANVICTGRGARSLLVESPWREAATGLTTLGKLPSSSVTCCNNSAEPSSFFSVKFVSLNCRVGGGGLVSARSA